MSELTHFLRNYQQEEEGKKVETDKLKEEWVKAVGEFQNRIIGWLTEPISLSLVTFTQPKIEITEDRFGKYEVEELELVFPGNKRVIFEPKARFIVGGQGRVDVHNLRETWKLIRKSAKEGWFLVAPESGQGTGFKLVEFDEQRFEYLLKKLLK